MSNKKVNNYSKNNKYLEYDLDAFNERDFDMSIDLDLKNHTSAVVLWLELFQNHLM